jgi:uncharacterized protein YbjQ (UPF0145 family)
MPNPVARRVLLLLSVLILAAALTGCTGGPKVEVPILVQELPARAPDAKVDFYWSQKSLEGWLQLAANPEKEPDLVAAGANDTHALWENRAAGIEGRKVADLVAGDQISLKHPREYLLAELAVKARELGADGVIVNSLRVQGLTGHQMRDDYDALWRAGTVMKVWVYAQAVRYE